MVIGDTRGADPLEKRKLIANIREEGLGHGEKGDYVSFKGTVTFITKSDKDPWYNACPKCSKKVVEVGNEIYRCERCDSESSTVSLLIYYLFDFKSSSFGHLLIFIYLFSL